MSRIELALIALVSLAAAANAADDPRIPPTEKEYTVHVVEQETGAPVAGVTVRATEHVEVRVCYSLDEAGHCQDCVTEYWDQTLTLTTGANGTASGTFELPYCEQWSTSPPAWETFLHAGWGDPEMLEDPAAGIDPACILARWQTGPGSYVHTLYVTREQRLAERFAPILHKHRGRELQADLGDADLTLAHSTLNAFDVLGRRVYGPSPVPPLHTWSGGQWDSFGFGTIYVWWYLDIDNDYRHAGAPAGSRPLYYHVFPYEDGAVIQYWMWFNADDLRELPGPQGLHEGDWEYLALYATFDGERWVPERANLSQHRGGNSVPADALWWSATDAPSYQGLEPGFDPERPHPHVWLAANSHAVYNRYEPQYRLAFHLDSVCEFVYADRLDYNISDNPAGDHAYFAYDQLVQMGEYWNVEQAHGETYFSHVDGGPLDFLRFVGRFGDSFCAAPPSCSVGCDLPGVNEMLWAPHSPIVADEPHLWRSFHQEEGRWGNPDPSSAEITWEEVPPLGDYLGEYAMCAEGFGDSIAFTVAARDPTLPGIALITVVSGDVQFACASPAGEIDLGPAVDGRYRFRESEVSGAGEVRIDIHAAGEPGSLDAEDLRLDVVADPCLPASAGPGSSPGASDSPYRIGPNPASGFVEVRLEAPASGTETWGIYDVAGREVAAGTLEPGQLSLLWRGRDEDGNLVGSGTYFLRLIDPGGAVTTRGVTVLR